MNNSEKSILHYMESLGEETTTREINEGLMIANIQTTRKYVGNLKKLGFIEERVLLFINDNFCEKKYTNDKRDHQCWSF